MESLTDSVESAAWEYLERIDEMGGAVAAIESGYMQGEIEQAAYAFAKAVDDEREDRRRGQQLRRSRGSSPPRSSRSTPPRPQPDRPHQAGASRARPGRRRRRLVRCAAAARGTRNLLDPMRVALRRMATLGEVSDVLREAFGVYQPGR